MGISLAKALRNKKTLANQLATLKNRAINSAVIDEGEKSDFDFSDMIAKFEKTQADLRDLKTAVAQKTLGTLVPLPDCGNLFPESGMEVPLFKAILIRDDLKSRKVMVDQICALSNKPVRTSYHDNAPVVNRVRVFNFEEYIALSDALQSAIDGVDAAIQYYDNSAAVEIQ